jgi:hypothetical protein
VTQVTDRHAIVPHQLVGAYLSTLHTALAQTVKRGRLWCGERHADDAVDDGTYARNAREGVCPSNLCCGNERLLGAHLNRSGVRVRSAMLPVVIVKAADDPTRWKSGDWLHEHTHDRWARRAHELLPREVLLDLRCVRIKLPYELPPAVDMCYGSPGEQTAAWVATWTSAAYFALLLGCFGARCYRLRREGG